MTPKGQQADPHIGREPCACVTNKDDPNTASSSVLLLHLFPILHSHSKHINRVIPLRIQEYVTPPLKNVPVFLSLRSNHQALPHLPFMPHLGPFFLLPQLIWYTGFPELTGHTPTSLHLHMEIPSLGSISFHIYTWLVALPASTAFSDGTFSKRVSLTSDSNHHSPVLPH